MSENLTITKEQLVSLLKAAHAAYKGEMKPPHSTTSDWASWYADYVVNQLKKPTSPDASKINPPRASTNKVSTGKLPDLPDAPSESTGFKDIKPKKPEPVATSAPKVANPAEVPPKTGGASKTLQVCPTCAHRNRPGILFCENCGTNLVTGAQSVPSTRDLREPQESAATSTNISKAPETEKPALDTTEAQAVRTAGSSIFNSDMLLRIEVEGGATPIVITPKAEDMILGRRDPTTGATPEVDLTSYAGESSPRVAGT